MCRPVGECAGAAAGGPQRLPDCQGCPQDRQVDMYHVSTCLDSRYMKSQSQIMFVSLFNAAASDSAVILSPGSNKGV